MSTCFVILAFLMFQPSFRPLDGRQLSLPFLPAFPIRSGIVRQLTPDLCSELAELLPATGMRLLELGRELTNLGMACSTISLDAEYELAHLGPVSSQASCLQLSHEPNQLRLSKVVSSVG